MAATRSRERGHATCKFCSLALGRDDQSFSSLRISAQNLLQLEDLPPSKTPLRNFPALLKAPLEGRIYVERAP